LTTVRLATVGCLQSPVSLIANAVDRAV